MRMRRLWQWPALFVAFLGLTAGMAEAARSGSSDFTVVASKTPGARSVVSAPAVLAELLREVDPVERPGSVRASRALADALDRAVEMAMRAQPQAAPAEIAGLARCVMLAEALRSPDKGARRAAWREAQRLYAAPPGTPSA